MGSRVSPSPLPHSGFTPRAGTFRRSPQGTCEANNTLRVEAEGACRLLADGVDIRTIQLILGHADMKQTQRYLNITDEELRSAMTGVWERRRQLWLSTGSSRPADSEGRAVDQAG